MAYGLSAPNLVLNARNPPSFLICCILFCCLVKALVSVAEESSLLESAANEEDADRCSDVRGGSVDNDFDTEEEMGAQCKCDEPNASVCCAAASRSAADRHDVGDFIVSASYTLPGWFNQRVSSM